MSSKFRDGQPWWFLPAVAFLLGLLIGWLVIGWGIWPVTYTNSLPQDLRALEKQEYLLMTAESFANSGDLGVAQRRVDAWPDAELQADLTTLIQRLEVENPLQASQVMQLEGALYPGGITPPEGAGASPAILPESPPEASNLLRTACTTALWVLLALAGILAILALWRRWRTASQPVQPDIEGLTPTPTPTARDTGMRGFPEVEIYDDEITRPLTTPSSRPAAAPVMVQDEVIYDEDDDEFDDEGADDDLEPIGSGVAEDEAEIEPEVVRPGVSRQFPRPNLEPEHVERVATAVTAATATGGMTKVGEYEGHYEMGAADYDEAFDIFDASGAYIGQCGIELVDPVGKMHDQAAALQVWLWDTNDPDTKVKVLMSEGAYRDTAMRDQLAGDHEVMPVRQGTEFELRSYNLLLKGIVDKVEYAEQEPVGGIFSEMQTRLAVYLK